MKVNEDGTTTKKKPEEFNSDDFKMMEKMPKSRNFCIFGLGPDKCETYLGV